VFRPFAREPGGYATAIGPEPYITIAGNERVAGTRCSFRSGMIFALQPGGRPGIIVIGTDGRARRLASLAATLTPTGITFDSTGHFGHKLVVTARNHASTAVLAIDCAGGVHTITTQAPPTEGGIAVAPASFGRYGGDLIAPNETSGRCSPSGRTAPSPRSRYPACRTAAISVSRAPGSSRQDSVPATLHISPTGTPKATSTRGRTAFCACPAQS